MDFSIDINWWDIILWILGTVLLLILPIYLAIRQKKPKLIVNSEGRGGGCSHGSVQRYHVTIQNDPTFMYILKVKREPAEIKQVFLQDNRTKKRYHLPCNWLASEFSNSTKKMTIPTGSDYAKKLALFVQALGSEQYYICQGIANKIPENEYSFNEPKNTFTLMLTDEIEREYSIDIFVSNHSPYLTVNSVLTRPERLMMMRDAWKLVCRAVQLLFRALKP